MPQSRMNSQRGFTLLELMIVLLMAGILVMVAAPSFQATLQRNRLQTTLNDLVSAFAFSRSQAISLTSEVVLCPSTDGATCSTSATVGDGYIVFVDDGRGAGGVARDRTVNGDEQVLRAGQTAHDGVTVKATGFAGTAIAFLGNGTAVDAGTVVMCGPRGAGEAKALILNRTGQVRIALDEDASGIVNDNLGADVTCP